MKRMARVFPSYNNIPRIKNMMSKVVPWTPNPQFIVTYAKKLHLYIHYIESIINATLPNNNEYKC